MTIVNPAENDMAVLEKAAKYICNFRDGLCPMVVENFSCTWACSQDTQPWRCWIELFRMELGKMADGKRV